MFGSIVRKGLHIINILILKYKNLANSSSSEKLINSFISIFYMGLVEQLEYAGADPDHGFGYIEALIIKVELPLIKLYDEKFVLHKYSMSEEISSLKPKNQKIEFENKEELIKCFLKAFGGNKKDLKPLWQETDETCGYQIPKEDFNTAWYERYQKARKEELSAPKP